MLRCFAGLFLRTGKRASKMARFIAACSTGAVKLDGAHTAAAPPSGRRRNSTPVTDWLISLAFRPIFPSAATAGPTEGQESAGIGAAFCL